MPPKRSKRDKQNPEVVSLKPVDSEASFAVHKKTVLQPDLLPSDTSNIVLPKFPSSNPQGSEDPNLSSVAGSNIQAQHPVSQFSKLPQYVPPVSKIPPGSIDEINLLHLEVRIVQLTQKVGEAELQNMDGGLRNHPNAMRFFKILQENINKRLTLVKNQWNVSEEVVSYERADRDLYEIRKLEAIKSIRSELKEQWQKKMNLSTNLANDKNCIDALDKIKRKVENDSKEISHERLKPMIEGIASELDADFLKSYNERKQNRARKKKQLNQIIGKMHLLKENIARIQQKLGIVQKRHRKKLLSSSVQNYCFQPADVFL